ncbi:hypothetical protein TeGR_g6645, partial [Tetraparma gracilis]
MSLAYIDPGNLESDLQTGAYTQYQLVWVLFSAIVGGMILQELSSRVGVASGMDLAQNSREMFSRPQSLFLYCMMEVAIIGSDIQEVLGSAIAIKILSSGRIPLVYGCLITGLDTFTFLFVHHCGARYLEALIFGLIAAMAACFFVIWVEVDVDKVALVEGWFGPTGMKTYAVVQAVGMVGAVIMPHNLYLHSGIVQSREVDKDDVAKVREANRYFLVEAILALSLSFVVNLAILSTFAEFFFDEACAENNHACMPDSAFSGDDSSEGAVSCGSAPGFSCGEIGLDTAGPALQEKLGQFGLTMWALGLLAAGQASTMTATLAGQITMSGFLDLQVPVVLRVALTRFIALGPAIFVCWYTADDTGLRDKVNEWLNILQSVQLPFAIFPLLLVAGDRNIMGVHFLGGFWKRVCWALGAVVLAINLFLIVQFVFLGGGDDSIPSSPIFKPAMGVLLLMYAPP